MALSLGAVSASTSRVMKKIHHWVTNIADTVTAATGDVLVLYDASDNYEPKYVPVSGLAGTLSTSVAVGDVNTTLSAANSGRPHIIANVSADRTYTLPAAAAGLQFSFIAEVGAADGHDWIFLTAAPATLFKGGVLMVDTDAGPATVAAVVADQSDDDQLQVNLPQGGTLVEMYCDGTSWIVSGVVVSATAAVFS
jgi:diaminopimelate epimerase